MWSWWPKFDRLGLYEALKAWQVKETLQLYVKQITSKALVYTYNFSFGTKVSKSQSAGATSYVLKAEMSWSDLKFQCQRTKSRDCFNAENMASSPALMICNWLC